MYKIDIMLLNLSDFIDESKYFRSRYKANKIYIYDVDGTNLFNITKNNESYYDAAICDMSTWKKSCNTTIEMVEILKLFSTQLRSISITEKRYTVISKTSYRRLADEFSKILTLLSQGKTIYDKGDI